MISEDKINVAETNNFVDCLKVAIEQSDSIAYIYISNSPHGIVTKDRSFVDNHIH